MSLLETKVTQLLANIEKFEQIVQGDENTEVSTTGGIVPSLKKLQNDNLAGLISDATEARDQAVAANEAIGDAASVTTTARDQAVAAKDLAETARDQASGYRNQAQTAASDAQIAQTTASAASGTAVSAASAASSDATVASGARDDAVTAKNAAQAAATAAGTSETNALSHKNSASSSASSAGTSETNALSYKNAAQSAKTNAETAATTATTKASEATAAAALAEDYANAPVGEEVEPGKYSAYHYAQQTAAIVSGGILFRGGWDPSSGSFPTPLDSEVAGDLFKVTGTGTVGSVSFSPGDSIIYEGSAGTWFKQDGSDAVQSVAGRIGAVVLTKSDVGLPDVDNTPDSAKPVSTAQQTALDLKADQADLDTLSAAQSSTADDLATHAGQSNPHGTTKTDLGLSAVENKSSATIRSELTSSNVTTALGFVPLAASVVSTDGTMSANSDSKVPTEKAVVSYVASAIAANDVMVFKGGINASANPNFPAADAGWSYRITVAGKIGGASGANVEVGDQLMCVVDASISGDFATVGANWVIAQSNVDGAVVGPTSSVNNRVVMFDGTSGRVIKDSGLTLAGNNTGDETTATIGSMVAGSTAKSTLVDADNFAVSDSAASNVLKKHTWAALKQGIWAAWGAMGASFGANKATPVGGDAFAIADSAASNATKYVLFSDLLTYVFGGLGGKIAAGTDKATPVDADTFAIADSAASSATKKLTWANVKATLAAATWNFTGSLTVARALMKFVKEVVTISATAANGTIQFDALTQGVLYYTSNATANFGLNVRGDSGTTLNSLMSTGESLTVVFMGTMGGTAYIANTFSIDGTSRTVKWQDGTAPATGNASSVEVYTYTAIKTADATFTVLGSRTKYA